MDEDLATLVVLALYQIRDGVNKASKKSTRCPSLSFTSRSASYCRKMDAGGNGNERIHASNVILVSAGRVAFVSAFNRRNAQAAQSITCCAPNTRIFIILQLSKRIDSPLIFKIRECVRCDHFELLIVPV